MNKLFKLLPLVVAVSLTACEQYEYAENNQPLLLFGTTVSFRMRVEKSYNGGKTLSDIVNTLKRIDELADATKQREKANVWDLNRTNDKTKINGDLYDLLETANELKESVKYFNPFLGSLSNKWKTSLQLSEENPHPAVLSNEEIEEELAKTNGTSLNLTSKQETYPYTYYAQREGEGLIDLGAIAKGYALDECLMYLNNHTGDSEDYLINAGKSSILLGENLQRKDKSFIVEVSEKNPRVLINASNSFVSTSGVSEQGVEIDGTIYSHIVNPETGSVVSNYDQITVVAPNVIGCGVLSDALSTSLMMMASDEEIIAAEAQFGVMVIAIKDGKIVYKSDGVTLSN